VVNTSLPLSSVFVSFVRFVVNIALPLGTTFVSFVCLVVKQSGLAEVCLTADSGKQ
jgi:hypothetical protein